MQNSRIIRKKVSSKQQETTQISKRTDIKVSSAVAPLPTNISLVAVLNLFSRNRFAAKLAFLIPNTIFGQRSLSNLKQVAIKIKKCNNFQSCFKIAAADRSRTGRFLCVRQPYLKLYSEVLQLLKVFNFVTLSNIICNNSPNIWVCHSIGVFVAIMIT